MVQCIERRKWYIFRTRKHDFQREGEGIEELEDGMKYYHLEKCIHCAQQRRVAYKYSYGESKISNGRIFVDVCSPHGRLTSKSKAWNLLEETAKAFHLEYDDPHLEFEDYYCHAGCHYFGTRCIAVAKVKTIDPKKQCLIITKIKETEK